MNNKTKDFITKSKNVHKNKYDYLDTFYINAKTKVKIKCLKHGTFYQTPNNHLSGKGCRQCATEVTHNKQKYTTKVFVEKCSKIHNKKYDYSQVVYTNSYNKVDIICPIHGIFRQRANHHLQGVGCKKCAFEKNVNFTRSSWVKKYIDTNIVLYVLYVYSDKENFIKLGITGNLKQRIKNIHHDSNYKIIPCLKIVGNPYNVWNLEKWLHRKLSKYKCTPNNVFKGYTECFNIKVLKEIPKIIKTNKFINVV